MLLETQRLSLKKFSKNDAPFLYQLANTPSFLKYIGNRNINSINDAKIYIQENHIKSYTTFGYGFYQLLLKEENQKPIGTCGLVNRTTLKHIELGFALLPEYEQKGYGYEASLAILNLAKNTFKIHDLKAITLPNNTRSIHLLEKLGFSYQKQINYTNSIEETPEELSLYALKL